MFHNDPRAPLIACLLGFGSVVVSQAQIVVESHFLPQSGNYSDPANWSPAEVPNNTSTRSYNVVLPPNVFPAIDLDVTISNLTQTGGEPRYATIYDHTFTVTGRTEIARPDLDIAAGVHPAGALFAPGDFSALSRGVLTGKYRVSSYEGSPARIRFRGAPVLALRDAELSLTGLDASVEDESGNDALRELAEIDVTSTLSLNGRDLVTSASLSVTGTLRLGGYWETSVTATAGLTNFDPATRTLSSGHFVVGEFGGDSEPPRSAVLRFAGADIVNLASALEITNQNSRIADLNGLDALRNLGRITSDGSLTLTQHSLVVPGDLTNDGELVVSGSNLTIIGKLTNFNPATRTLENGSFAVYADGYYAGEMQSTTALLQFAGADIVSNAARLVIGNEASITDELGRDGLRNFAENLSTGAFVVASGQRFTTTRGFTNSGSVRVSGSTGGWSSPHIPEGEFTVAPGFVYKQTAGALHVNGVLTADRLEIGGGSLSGSGAINGDVSVGDAMLQPGSTIFGPLPFGTLTLSGRLTLSESSVVQFVFTGTTPRNLTALRVAGDVVLDGALEIEMPVDYFFPSTAEFTILQSDQPLTGEFRNAPAGTRITTLGGLGSFVVRYEANAVKLTGFQASAPAAQLLNISTRGYLKPGTDIFGNRTLIGGLIITGSEPKKVVVRSLGPSLSRFNIGGTAPDPVLSLRRTDQSVAASNDDWKSAQHEEIAGLGLAPGDDREPALIVTLDPGFYTVVVEEKTGTAGNALIEIYDLSPSANGKLGNLSTRGWVTADDPLIGGIIVGGAGQANAEVVVRAIGPRLGRSGDYTSMADPTLELRDRDGELLAFNDDFGENSNQFTGSARQLLPFDPKESAMRVSLPAGHYTAVLRGKNGGTGTGLVEFYDLRR